MKKYFAIILILLFAFLPAFAQFEEDGTQQPAPQPQYTAPVQNGSISGIVVCPNEKDESKLDPVAGAQILVESSSYGAITRTDGTFFISGVPYGDYKITAKKDGFYSDEKIVTINAQSSSVTMTITSTKEKTVKTKPGKNITGGKVPSGMVFVAFASPASPKNQAVASRVGSLDDAMSMDSSQVTAAIIAGTDPLNIGGLKPKYPHSYDPLVPSTAYQNSIMLFDTKTPAKSTYVNLQSQVYWMVYNPENKLLYISSQSQMILVYDPGKNEVIGGLGVNGQITDMCLNNDGSLLYVAVMGKPNAISTLDCYKNKFINNKKHVVQGRPAAIVTSIDGKTLYFAMGSPSTGAIYAINAESGTKTGEVKVGNNPNGLCMRPDGKEIYVSNLNAASVSVVDPATLTVKAVVPVGIEPFKMVASKDNSKIYVVCRKGNRIDIIDTTSHTVSKSVKTGDCPTGIAINGDGSRVFVTNNESRTVSIIDTKSDNVIQTTMAQPRSQPWGIAVK